jgi:hypothetical protein
MTQYWDTIPVGVWRVVDYIDALNALNDPESRFVFDKKHNRIHVLGPIKKAVWIDMTEVEKTCTKEQLNKLDKIITTNSRG